MNCALCVVRCELCVLRCALCVVCYVLFLVFLFIVVHCWVGCCLVVVWWFGRLVGCWVGRWVGGLVGPDWVRKN